jgi:transcription elongation GreA/GreB family factor
MALGGIAFEAELTREQAERLSELMADARPTRPEGVLTASLEYHDGRARLVAIWRDEETLSDYLAQGSVPRGTELMRAVGAEPAVSRFEVLELG